MTTWLLLRGLARESRHWGAFAGTLQSHAGAHDSVIAMDLPGTGHHAAAKSPRGVTAIAQWCSDRLDSRAPVIVVGMSLGGLVAIELARLAPRQVAGLVLINSSVAGLSAPWLRLRPRNYLRLAVLLAGRGTLLARERAILAMTSNRFAADEGIARAWADHAHDAPMTRANVLRQLAAAARFRPHGRPPVPVIVVASEHDRFVSVDCSLAIARHWHLPVVVHPSAGHDLALDAPAWLAGRLAQWSRGLGLSSN